MDSMDYETSNEEGQQALANGLRNLAQRQHERIYSGKSCMHYEYVGLYFIHV